MGIETEETAIEIEIRRRVLDVENGEMELIDHEVVMREEHERLADLKIKYSDGK